MRFLADMGISPLSVAFLREHGHDAAHLFEESLHRLPDHQIIAKARQEERILLTHDLDFGEILALTGAERPSVITFRLKNMRPEMVNRYLGEALSHFGSELERGAILSITEPHIRCRILPI